MSKISIVIPVYNESLRILNTLKYVLAHSSVYNIIELIVVDGGSTDDTAEKVQQWITLNKAENDLDITTVKLLPSEKGRAKQMNLGAQVALGDILYFLHADSFPPKYFDQFIVDEIKNGYNCGCFKMTFDSEHWWLKLAGWFTKFNWKMCRGGDQSLFISKSLFNQVGGYNEQYIIYEDNALISQLYKVGKFKVIPQTITTSARLYKKHGIWKLQYHYWMVHLKKRLGASPDSLYRYYQSKILNT
jgi:rSAM/selenodomain-associated transferase 2